MATVIQVLYILPDWPDYLANRKQAVRVNEHLSSWRETSCGVPQGSGLGPLLFLVSIDDLPGQCENCQINLFADDTVFHCSGNNKEFVGRLNKDHESVRRWLKSNYLSLKCTLSWEEANYRNYCISID